MADSNVKLTVDTSQAVLAIKGLNTAWVNAAAGMAVIEKAFNMVSSAASGVNQAIRDQAQFFSAVKNDMQLASVQMAMAASDGMIKPMTLAKGANTLMRGDLKLTQDQMDAVAKAAVEIGRATGEDVNQVFDRLSKGILKGSTEAFSEYGIQVSNVGTIQQRQQRILEQVTARYGGLSIAVNDAAEAQDAAANKSQIQMIQIAKQADSLSQTWTKFKDFYTGEFLAGGIDKLFGTSTSRTNQVKEMISNLEDVLGAKTNEINTDTQQLALEKQKYAALKEQGATYADLMVQRDKIDKLDRGIVDKSKEAKDTLNAIGKIVDQNNVSYANSGWLNAVNYETTALIEDSTKNINYNLVNQERTAASLVLIWKDMLPAVKNVFDAIPITFDLKAWRYEGSDQQRKDKENALARAKQQSEAAAAAWEQARKEERESIRQFYEDRRTAKAEAALKELDDERRARDAAVKDSQDKDLAFEINKDRQRRALDEARGEQIMSEADRVAKKETSAKKKALDEDLENRKQYVAKTKELVEGLAAVSINAIFAEKKARDGLSRTDYMMKQLAAYMKGEALKYAAKSIGYLAEGVAATFWNPPAAAAAFKASALSAAAAVAFGGGAAAASAAAGSSKKASSGAASNGASSTPQRETMTGTSTQRTEVTVILGGRGVVIGDQDALARAIGNVMDGATRRGVIRG